MGSIGGRAAVWALGLGMICASVRGEDSIFFHNDYAEALREAKQTGKPIFLEFRCAP